MLEACKAELTYRNFEEMLAGDVLYVRLKGRSCATIGLNEGLEDEKCDKPIFKEVQQKRAMVF